MYGFLTNQFADILSGISIEESKVNFFLKKISSLRNSGKKRVYRYTKRCLLSLLTALKLIFNFFFIMGSVLGVAFILL